MASVKEYKKRAAGKPSKFGDDEVLSWVSRLWGTEELSKNLEIKFYDSYDDANVCIRNISRGSQFLLKVRNAVESKDEVTQEGIIFLMRSLEGSGGGIVGVETPRLVPLLEGGKFYSKVKHNVEEGGIEDLAIWLQTWIPGHTMSSSKCVDPPLLEKVGGAVARVSVALADISHPGLKRHTYPWDLANVPMLEQYFSYLPEGPTRRDMVANILTAFNRTVVPSSSTFRRSAVHGDINDSNIILTTEKGGDNVKGIIDWCDACESWAINEIAIAMAYAMVTSWAKETGDVLGAAAIVLRGYAAEDGMQLNIRFPSGEMKHLRTLVAARLAQSVTLGTFTQVMGSNASNVCVHSIPAWRALEILWLDSPAAYCKTLWKNALWGVESVSLLRGGSSRVPLVQEMRLYLPGNKTDHNDMSGGGNLAHDVSTSLSPRTVCFITGNLNKLKEVNAILHSMCKDGNSPISLVHRKLDLPELQGDPVSIAQEKCRVASCRVMGPVIVEDTSLCFNSMGGLPGPYVKDFLEKLGPENLALMLSSYVDKSANAQCIFTFCEGPGEKVQVFKGITKGRIVYPPRGKRIFGWDCIFEPLQEELKGMDGESDYHGLTYAELPIEIKNRISHRYKAVFKLGDALMKRFSG
eukprot:468843_1